MGRSLLVRARLNKELGLKHNFNGKTDIGEPVVGGMVGNVKDGSIAELLASKRIVRGGKIVDGGPDAKHVIVVETDMRRVPFNIREGIHGRVIKAYGDLWDIAVRKTG